MQLKLIVNDLRDIIYNSWSDITQDLIDKYKIDDIIQGGIWQSTIEASKDQEERYNNFKKEFIELQPEVYNYGKAGKYKILYTVFSFPDDIKQLLNSSDGPLVKSLVHISEKDGAYDKIYHLTHHYISEYKTIELSNTKLYNIANKYLIAFVLAVLLYEIGELFYFDRIYAQKLIDTFCFKYTEVLDKDIIDTIGLYKSSRYEFLLKECKQEVIYNTLLPDYVTILNRASREDGVEGLNVWPFNNDIVSLVLTQLSWLNFNESMVTKLKLLGIKKVHGADILALAIYSIIKDITLNIYNKSR